MEKVKLPKLVQKIWQSKNKKSGKEPGFYQHNKSKKKGIAATKPEENSTKNKNKTKRANFSLDSPKSLHHIHILGSL